MLKKLKLTAALLLCFSLVLSIPAQTVYAKTTSKKSVTFTLTDKRSYSYELYLKKSAKVKVTVKILGASGKPTEDIVYWWGIYGTGETDGELFHNVKASKFKKNKTLTSKELSKKSFNAAIFNFDIPEGMKKLKVKLTVSSVDGKKVIEYLGKPKGWE